MGSSELGNDFCALQEKKNIQLTKNSCNTVDLQYLKPTISPCTTGGNRKYCSSEMIVLIRCNFYSYHLKHKWSNILYIIKTELQTKLLQVANPQNFDK